MNSLLAHWQVAPKIQVHCEPSFPLEERIYALARQKGVLTEGIFNEGQVQWDLLQKIWGGALYINPNTALDWKEEILTIVDLEQSLSSPAGIVKLEGRKTDSYTVQAQRQGHFPDSGNTLQTAVVGILENYNGTEIILGRRAGSEGIGQVIPVPAGAVPYPPGQANNYDCLTPAFLREAVEEVGILPEEISDSKLIGIYRQELGSATPSNVFLYLLRLEGTTANLKERHQRAFEYYESTKRESSGNIINQEIYARRALQQRAAQVQGFPADA